MIGKTVAHYRILEPLGQGGMGEVYLAEDTKLDRKVALKFLPPAVWNEAEAQQRLIREAKAASQLDHPNIVTIYGIEEADGRPFIHMAHVRGVTLNAWCTAEPRTTDQILDLVEQIADALEHAHGKGVIHRDLKPANILVDERGRARILDFGIASLRGAAKLTQTGFTVGTLAYAPPELIQGKQAEAPADIYSLGVVMYQMLTGHLPFEADHEAALLYAVLQDQPQPLSAHRSDVKPELQRIVSRCLEKDPARRYASCAELLEELRRLRPRGGAATDGDADKPSLAVLPFANMSADPENEYFSDGLSEELMNVLAKNPGLKVTGRTSSFAFKGRNEDLREIGQKLGVATLLEGSVRKAGNRVRITTQLIKVTDGFHLWSETYDRVLDDIFAVQDDIAKAVSTALHVTLLGAPAAPTAKLNVESYNLVLQANHLRQRNTRATSERAVELYRQALAIDPNDARAWAGLAITLGTQAGYGFAPPEAVIPSMEEALEKALALDDGLAEAYTTKGWMLAGYGNHLEEAYVAFRKAESLSPGMGEAITGLATIECTFGRFDEALRLAGRAVELDPLSPMVHMLVGRVRWVSRRYDEALASFANALELSPGLIPARGTIGLVLLLQGRTDEAVEEAMKEPSEGYRNWALGCIHHTRGDRQASDEALRTLLDLGTPWGVQIAAVYAWRGENDPAFEWLERARVSRDPGIPFAKVHPLFDGLHDDPRWPELLERLGFPV